MNGDVTPARDDTCPRKMRFDNGSVALDSADRAFDNIELFLIGDCLLLSSFHLFTSVYVTLLLIAVGIAIISGTYYM